MPLEVMAQQYILNKKSRRVQQVDSCVSRVACRRARARLLLLEVDHRRRRVRGARGHSDSMDARRRMIRRVATASRRVAI